MARSSITPSVGNSFIGSQSPAQPADQACVRARNASAFHSAGGRRIPTRLRERVLVWLDMTLGLRRGELAGLRWEDILFEDLTVMAQRSIVDQVVGNVKTEASKRPIPIDPFIAEDLLALYRTTKYNRPEDYVFATDAARCRPKARQATALVVQSDELPHPAHREKAGHRQADWLAYIPAHLHDLAACKRRRRGGGAGAAASRFAKITIDDAQAVTPAKRKAQEKVVAMLRDTKKAEPTN